VAEDPVAEVKELISPYAGNPGDLTRALHRVQKDLGHIPPDSSELMAELMRVPPSRVNEVVTFYHRFRLTPPGRPSIEVCLGTACHVRGAERMSGAIREEAGAGLRYVSSDGLFDIQAVRCLGRGD